MNINWNKNWSELSVRDFELFFNFIGNADIINDIGYIFTFKEAYEKYQNKFNNSKKIS